jgi:hypothetical protein
MDSSSLPTATAKHEGLDLTAWAEKVEHNWNRISAGEQVEVKEVLDLMTQMYASGEIQSLIPVLGLLSLRGQPYSLERYFTMEPMFKLLTPVQMLLKCGRQISKSTTLAARGVLTSAGYPYLRSLFITPRYEQVRKLSTNYVKPFISSSELLSRALTNVECSQQVLQRSFANGADMFFGFAFLDAERNRGIACDIIYYDEIQDLDYDFLPIIKSCMDASDLGLSYYSGTPKTLDNGIQALWEKSSQAEWVIPCFRCGHWNVPSVHYDLLKMIGLKGIVCGKCSKPVDPRDGHWYHMYGKDFPHFHAYHIPQIIMPMHYENPRKWLELLEKRAGQHFFTEAKFLNEVLGESADTGVKLVTVTDIREASQLNVNDFNEAVRYTRNKAGLVTLGVDWGGGGEDEISYTTLALVAQDPGSGQMRCHYCERFHTGYSHDQEAKRLLEIFRESGCHYFAHDFGGSGSVRETLMIQAGLPPDRIIGFEYVRAHARDMVYYRKPHPGEMRGRWMLDKARSLVLQAVCVKSKTILLPHYDSSKLVTHDMLALMEDKHEMPKASDMYLIRRVPKQSDDFAHALNYACVAIWHATQKYPDLSSIQGIKLTEEQLNLAEPPHAFRESEHY